MLLLASIQGRAVKVFEDGAGRMGAVGVGGGVPGLGELRGGFVLLPLLYSSLRSLFVECGRELYGDGLVRAKLQLGGLSREILCLPRSWRDCGGQLFIS